MENYLDLSKFKQSSIGTNVESDLSELKIDYKFTGIGWFLLTFFGTTQTPVSITFTCLRTEEVFEQLVDKSRIKYYMLYTRK
jgi:hypothetical protein